MRFFLTLSFIFVLFPSFASAATFTQQLRLGSVGAEVLELQKILNTDPATAVALSGPGSPGNETAYFGPATRRAVVTFQEKYRAEILIPNGLVIGTGIVGLSTRTVLEQLASAHVQPAILSPVASSTTGPPANNQASAPSNPNLVNLDLALSYIDKIGAKQNYSQVQISDIKEAIKKEAATTTDLRASFMKTIPVKTAYESPLGQFIGKIQDLFGIQRAYAAAALPFGGAILYVFPCTCSATWHITVSPLPPTYVVLLTYVPFTQAFLSYNIPFTNWLLGYYEPGAAICKIYVGFGCSVVPAEGLITPVTGSSPL